MSFCQRAHCRAWGREVNKLPQCDSLRRTYGFSQASPFSTAQPTRKSSAKERQRAQREHLIKSLKESPGKRDARNFLKHFDAPKQPSPSPVGVGQAASDAVERAHHNEWRLTRTGVNLGNLYEPTKAIQNSPVFSQADPPKKRALENAEPLHLALVKLRQPQTLDDDTLGGIALTLSQMARLGLNIAVVIDCDEHVTPAAHDLSLDWEVLVREQLARIVTALEDFNEPGAFSVDHALTFTGTSDQDSSQGDVEVKNRRLLFSPIEDGIIVVVPPWAYDTELKKVRIEPDQALLALTREFAGLSTGKAGDDVLQILGDPTRRVASSEDDLILDRIIILDPLGGIPSDSRTDGAHVFINLEAEYRDVKKDLQKLAVLDGSLFDEPKSKLTKPDSKPAASEHAALSQSNITQVEVSSSRHEKNLDAVQAALRLLPPSSSALIITPSEAAISSQKTLLIPSSPGVRTRRSKNPLIHNLLTDKPMISSSLPGPLVTRHVESAAPTPSTFLKKGIPVTMIPDPRASPWQPPSTDNPSIELENDPRINFPKLVDLINDSFRRRLHVRDYLDRIRGRVAGIIIAGDYEGGAICTWETPPSLDANPPSGSHLWVPYLDKFAVRTSSQGSGGVADIVWGALTRTCFPNGLLWRSRTSNPVNKWYFERAVGMLNLPGGQWTMFWTTDGVAEEWAKNRKGSPSIKTDDGFAYPTRWDAYVSVCGGVVPTWADGKKPD